MEMEDLPKKLHRKTKNFISEQFLLLVSLHSFTTAYYSGTKSRITARYLIAQGLTTIQKPECENVFHRDISIQTRVLVTRH